MNPAKELKTAIVPPLTAGAEPPWNEVFDALTALRRILVYHPGAVTSKDLEKLVPGIVKAIRNSRSVLSKNAIYCAEDLFLKASSELNPNQKSIDALVFALLDSCASNMPKSIRAAAATALNQAVETGPLKKLSPALASRASHKNVDVAENAMVFCEKALKNLSVQGETQFAKNLDLERIFPGLNFGVNSKSAKGKKAAKGIACLLSSSLTQVDYEARVSALPGLTPLQVTI